MRSRRPSLSSLQFVLPSHLLYSESGSPRGRARARVPIALELTPSSRDITLQFQRNPTMLAMSQVCNGDEGPALVRYWPRSKHHVMMEKYVGRSP
jgi:hypothetical protein